MPSSASIDSRFKLYFYDQFADAADPGHWNDGSQELTGSPQFDEVGAWGWYISQTGLYQ